jgi:rod shape determining protein RodA
MSGSDNTNQSEIAIGSGGWLGKRTSRAPNQRRFVPEQHTDYIFTTVGEEWGFAGSVVMALFAGLLLRIIYLAERQKQNSVGFMVTVLQEFYLPTCKYCMVSGIFQLLEFHFRFSLTEDLDFGVYNFTIYFIKMDANKVNEW